jgi:hypothetical protein
MSAFDRQVLDCISGSGTDHVILNMATGQYRLISSAAQKCASFRRGKYGGFVRPLRESRGLSQEHLAASAEVSAMYIGFIERRDNVATLAVILQIA